MPMLSHEVLVTNVMYPAVLLAYDHSLSMLAAMASCLQGGLRVLSSSFCHMEALKNDERHVIIDQSGTPKLRIPVWSEKIQSKIL